MAESFVEFHYNAKEGFTLHVRPRDFNLIPEPTRKHVRGASKELLMAVRTFVDEAIQKVEGSGEEKRTRRRRIKVEG